MKRKTDPLRTRVARWLARTELRIEVQERVPAEGRQEGEWPPPLNDQRMLAELVGVIAVANLFSRDETLVQQAMRHARPVPAQRSTAENPVFAENLFPDSCRGVSIPDELLAGLVTRT